MYAYIDETKARISFQEEMEIILQLIHRIFNKLMVLMTQKSKSKPKI